MANRFRSSFEIKLNGQEYTLRPSFESIMEFESKAGMDILEAFNLFTQNKAGVKTTVAAIWAGIKAESKIQGDTCPSFEKIGRECQIHGFDKCLFIALEFFNNCLSSEADVKKQAGEAPKKEVAE